MTFIVFSLYTFVGNTLVCIVYIVDPFKRLRTVTFYYVVNLALADILVGVLVEPLNVSVYWTQNRSTLFAFYVLAVLSCVTSILNICALMLDRYIAVSQAVRYRVLVTVKRVRISIFSIWLHALHFALLPMVGWRDSSYQVYLYSLGVLLPTIVMLLSYRGLMRILKRKASSLEQSWAEESAQLKKMLQRERKVSQTVLIMLIVFLVAWFPFVVADFVLVFCPECRSHRLRLGRDIALSLGFFSSGINPLLYAWRVRQFRQGLLKIVKFKANTNVRSSKVVPFATRLSADVIELERFARRSFAANVFNHVPVNIKKMKTEKGRDTHKRIEARAINRTNLH